MEGTEEGLDDKIGVVKGGPDWFDWTVLAVSAAVWAALLTRFLFWAI